MLDSSSVVQERTTPEPCYSARLVAPFVRLLGRHPAVGPALLGDLPLLNPDDRLPIAAMHELLQGAVALTGDPDLGLKAAREITPGDYGALEYVARSAANWAQAGEATGRYMRLINDALQYSQRIEGDRALIALESSVPMPRTAADFQSGAFYVCTMFSWASESPPEYEVHFMHAEPADTREYAQTFSGGRVLFSAPWNGFVFPREYLDRPAANSDPKLHTLISQHAEALLASLPRAKTVTEQVRELIAKELGKGAPALDTVAQTLMMSARTLARRLEQENTSFKQLVEDMRQRLALRYVAWSDLPLSEIAFLLGFSQSAAFHRAFKRWTQQTPLEYRRAHRSALKAASS
jgi:AraC-like DNA-binding protein